jgi:hypothetical protein
MLINDTRYACIILRDVGCFDRFNHYLRAQHPLPKTCKAPLRRTESARLNYESKNFITQSNSKENAMAIDQETQWPGAAII